MQHGTEPLTDRWYFRAFKIHLAIHPHQQLHGLDLAIPGGHFDAVMNKFISEVLNGVAQYLKCMPRFNVDAAAAVRSQTRG